MHLNAAIAQDDGYQIGAGDILNISVWKEEDMDKQVLVKPDGAISFPLIGEVMAQGKTTAELVDSMKSGLKRYIPDPVVSVTVLQAVSNKVYVVGKVMKPGEYQATHYMDVLQALSVAGGLSPYADSDDIRIIRNLGGERQIFEFDYDEVIMGEDIESNIILRAGDTIAVP